MTAGARRLLMMGLPDSGKSTYIAALFHGLRQATDGLSLRHLPEEREYLLTLENRWLALEPVGHSAYPTPRQIELPIKDSKGRALDVNIPDVNGEEFGDAWESGEWSAAARSLLEQAQGVLLFVRANDVVSPKLIQLGNRHPKEEKPEPTPWKPQMGVTQAKLCDLLEQMAEMRGGALPAVAVVVSAWDSVEETLSPDGWLQWKLPLLNQWLQTSVVVSIFRLFGVSAQGGDIENLQTREKLAQLPRIERLGGVHALTDPLEWLLETP